MGTFINSGGNLIGTVNTVTMFTPNGFSVGDAPIKISPTNTRPVSTNLGTNSITAGYNNTLVKTDSMSIGYDISITGTGQEAYVFGNRTTITGSTNGLVSLGFLNDFSGTTQGAYVLGDSNTFTSSTSFSLVIGENNSLDALDQTTLVGNNNTFINPLNCRVIGSYNTISNSDQLYVIGDVNDIGSSSSNSIFNLLGNFNTIDGSTSLTIIGDNNDIASTSDCTIIGGFNTISGLSNKTIIATGGIKGGVVIDNITGNVGIGTLFSSTLTAALNVRGSVVYQIAGTMTMPNSFNLVFGTGSGTKIGTATTQKLGFWNVTPIVQPTTAVTASVFVANAGTGINSASTFDGYTIAKVVKALRNLGLLA